MQQNYVDILFQLQCCLANKAYELALAEQAGSSCIEKDSDIVNELAMYLRTLKRQNLDNLQCLTLDEIKLIIQKINQYCQYCCLEANKLKTL